MCLSATVFFELGGGRHGGWFPLTHTGEGKENVVLFSPCSGAVPG